MQNLPDQLKFTAASDDSHSRQVVIVRCADPGSLLNVAQDSGAFGAGRQSNNSPDSHLHVAALRFWEQRSGGMAGDTKSNWGHE